MMSPRAAGEPFGDGNFLFSAICKPGQEPTKDGRSCGCSRGSRLQNGVCSRCPTGYSAEVGESECLRCEEVRSAACRQALSQEIAHGGCLAFPQGFYSLKHLQNHTAGMPSNCIQCPLGARCPWDSEIKDIETMPNYWRLTAESDAVIKCLDEWDPLKNQSTPCNGKLPNTCDPGHTGPQCKGTRRADLNPWRATDQARHTMESN